MNPPIKRSILKAALTLFFLTLLFFTYCFIETYLYETIEIDFIDPDIPASFVGKRIVFASDIHHGSLFPRERIAEVVERINQLDPDIVILGGDYITRQGGSEDYVKSCFEELSQINATYGVYGVRGNHDNWADEKATIDAMQSAGITALDNRAEWLEIGGERIKIGGVGDLWTDTQDITPTTGDVTGEDFVILVSHNPDYTEGIRDNRIDLVLSGHTHGGQVSFFGVYTPYKTTGYGEKYVRGMVHTPYTPVYVSKGVGQSLPIRFFARPDIVVFTLEKG